MPRIPSHAIEVSSSRRRDPLPGIDAFLNRFPSARPLLIGGDGIPLERFLETPVENWLAG